MIDSSALPPSCSQCGAALPEDAAEETCPRCCMTQPAPPGAGAVSHFEAVTVVASRPRPTFSGSKQPDLPLPEELSDMLPQGNYRVTDFLGAGGMGAVYKGMQVRLKRPVAIKIMRRDLEKDHDFEQRFEREAQAMAKLNHPNIVSVIDYGEAGPDYLYIVMELVDGADLMDVIRAGQMTQEMVLTLVPQICDALQFAHDHGIVHRDIKPSNIMLTRDGRVKMADFGLAKHFDADSSFRTQTGTGMGTPDYAAPEQFGTSTDIDHRADIYALGVMIYQMITGQLPRGAWKAPSQRGEVAPQWDNIVSRAMQNDPADRYQQASEVKTDLDRIPLSAARAVDSAAAAPKPSPSTGTGLTGAGLRQSQSKSSGLLLLGLGAGAAVLALGAFLALKQPAKETLTTSQSPAAASETGIQGPPEAASAQTTPPSAPTKEVPFVNTLGMKFLPVFITGGPTAKQRVLFSVWETRVQDYEVFAKETKRPWQKPPFEQQPTHPVVSVNWNDATAFCAWLSAREHTAGSIRLEDAYRLPTSHEWSCAVGAGEHDNGDLPATQWEDQPLPLSMMGPWPPLPGSGNFSGEESRDAKLFPNQLFIEGYNDGFPHTSPAGHFAPNFLGLHDMEGNVLEWCADLFYGPEDGYNKANRTQRSAAFTHFYRGSISRLRPNSNPPHVAAPNLGFRCVLAPASGK